VEKNGQSINISRQECEQLIGVIFYMGLVQMPNLRSHWENELGFEPISSVLSRNQFLKLVTLLKLVTGFGNFVRGLMQ
jgi:hypothetical protein